MCTETFLRLPEEKRNRFLNAAWEEFTTKPFMDVSINKIVLRARIPRGSFYQYFSDKRDLFDYLLEDVRKRFITAYEELLIKSGGDVFDVQMRAYDHLVAQRGETTSILDNSIRILQINSGLDPENIIMGKPGEQVIEMFWNKLDISKFRCREPEFVRRVFSMTIMTLGPAIVDSLAHPERIEENRRELLERLEIIKCGSLVVEPV